jgi:hypothetical protein
MPIESDYIDEYIMRAKVAGGWLVYNVDSENVPVSLVFISDPGHSWQCESYYEGDEEEEEDE